MAPSHHDFITMNCYTTININYIIFGGFDREKNKKETKRWQLLKCGLCCWQ
jgi:hypothetical protein